MASYLVLKDLLIIMNQNEVDSL